MVHPVAAVKRDHQTTIRMRTFRGPKRAPSQPPGISNIAYAKVKAVKTQPNCESDSPNSDWMSFWAFEMQTRPTYRMSAGRDTNTTTQEHARTGFRVAVPD